MKTKFLTILTFFIALIGYSQDERIHQVNRGAMVITNGSNDATDPSSYEVGTTNAVLYFNNALKQLRWWDGVEWKKLGSGGDFIPLSGTEIGSPVTGNIDFVANDPIMTFSAFDGQDFVLKSYFDEFGFEIGSGNFKITNSIGRGLYVSQDGELFNNLYIPPASDQYYVQKKYVDDSLDNLVTLDTEQTITGNKTFTGDTSMRGALTIGEGVFKTDIITAGLTSNRAHVLPDASGTLALTTDITDDQNASEVTNTAVGNLTSTNVQASLEELQADIDAISSDNTILTTSLTTDTTLNTSEINDFNIFSIDDVNLTITIPQTTLAANEIKFITFLAPNEDPFTLLGDSGVNVPSPNTFSGYKTVTLYSKTQNVWSLYNTEDDAQQSGITTQNKGVEVDSNATTLNFTGEGVSVSDSGSGVTEVNIAGSVPVTTFDGQVVQYIKHPDNVGAGFEDYDFIVNYVSGDSLIVNLAQYTGTAQTYANLNIVEKTVLSPTYDIPAPVFDSGYILNGTFDTGDNIFYEVPASAWSVGGGSLSYDDSAVEWIELELSEPLPAGNYTLTLNLANFTTARLNINLYNSTRAMQETLTGGGFINYTNSPITINFSTSSGQMEFLRIDASTSGTAFDIESASLTLD